MRCFFLLSICLFFSVSSDFEEDLQAVLSYYRCNPNCTFKHSEITSKTLPFYPLSCSSICGILVVNENTDLPYFQLKALFEPLQTLRGGMRIENTSFQNLSFLSSSETTLNYFCYPAGTSIVNNSQLIDAKAIYNTYPISTPSEECPFYVLNNTKLDVSTLCESSNYNQFLEIQVYNNKKDCGCRGDQLTSGNMKSYKKCIALFNGLELTNMRTSPDLKSLSKISVIKGNIEIAYTNFTDLSFFKHLEKVRGRSFDSPETVILDIHDNPNMIRLGLNAVSYYLVGNVEYQWEGSMNLENLHPDFCLTYQEVTALSTVRFKNLQAKFCETEMDTGYTKSCNFTSMKNLDSDCVIIFGNVVIDSGDEEHVGKLTETIRDIYGSLTIQNTNLEDIRFLNSLNYIYFLHETIPVIRIINNPKLKKVSLPYMMSIFAKGKKEVVIDNNAPNLFRASISCLAFQHHIGANVTYNGRNCKAIDETKTSGEFGIFHVHFALLTLLVY